MKSISSDLMLTTSPDLSHRFSLIKQCFTASYWDRCTTLLKRWIILVALRSSLTRVQPPLDNKLSVLKSSWHVHLSSAVCRAIQRQKNIGQSIARVKMWSKLHPILTSENGLEAEETKRNGHLAWTEKGRRTAYRNSWSLFNALKKPHAWSAIELWSQSLMTAYTGE